MLRFILTAFSLLSASAWAASDPYAVEIQPPAQVRFVDVNVCSSTFEIELIGEEGAGPFYVSDQEILASVSAINRNQLVQSPKSILDHEYSLTKKISFHPPPFLEKRKKKYCH